MKSFATIETIHKDKKGYKFKYADMEGINNTINAYLIENKLSISSSVEGEFLVTDLINDKNEVLRTAKCALILESDSLNAKHDYGSAITYARKYNAKMMFNLSENDNEADKSNPNHYKQPDEKKSNTHSNIPPPPKVIKKVEQTPRKKPSDYTVDELMAKKEMMIANPNPTNTKNLKIVEAELSLRASKSTFDDLEPKKK